MNLPWDRGTASGFFDWSKPQRTLLHPPAGQTLDPPNSAAQKKRPAEIGEPLEKWAAG